MGKLMKNGRSYSGWGGSGGTTVVANPEGTATETLNKLQVGNSIYSIPSGGGGASGPVTWVTPDPEWSEIYFPYRDYSEEVVETEEGELVLYNTFTAPYTFTDPDSRNDVTVTFTIDASVHISDGHEVHDKIWFTDYVATDEHVNVTINTYANAEHLEADDPAAENYDFYVFETASRYEGHAYATIPHEHTFDYNGNQVHATYTGQQTRVDFGTYQSRKTSGTYVLGVVDPNS